MREEEPNKPGINTQKSAQSHLTLLHILKGHDDTILSIAWSPDGRMLASGSRDEAIRLWDVQTGQPLYTLEGHTGVVFSIAWSPDGRVLASGSGIDELTIRLWDVQTRQLLRILKGHQDSISNLAWS